MWGIMHPAWSINPLWPLSYVCQISMGQPAACGLSHIFVGSVVCCTVRGTLTGSCEFILSLMYNALFDCLTITGEAINNFSEHNRAASYSSIPIFPSTMSTTCPASSCGLFLHLWACSCSCLGSRPSSVWVWRGVVAVLLCTQPR